MAKQRQIDLEIDKLTRSIENAIPGDSFETEILALTPADVRQLKKADWLFDWKATAKSAEKTFCKLVIVDNSHIIQGLIGLQDRSDHVFMALIESSKFNRGARKVYLGVPGNLVAFACKLSFEKGYEGYISFESKTKLIAHYEATLGAHVLFGNIMALDTRAAARFVNQYFPNNS